MKKIMKYVGIIFLLALAGYSWLLYPFSLMSARSAVGEKDKVVVADRQIAYYSSGNGPRVILAASLAREASDFNELVQDLNNAGFRTVVVEAPGIGDSDILEKPTSLYEIAKDIKAVADDDVAKTGNEVTIALIGHAFGNRVMRATASKYPQLAKSVVLIAAGGQRPIAPNVRKELRNSAMPYLTSSRREEAIKFAFFAEGNEVPKFWLRGWHLQTGLLQATTVEHTENNDWQGAGGLPMLIVQAVEDAIAPKADTSDLLKERFGDQLEVVLVKNAGHALLPEKPEIISKAIIGFLNGHRFN